MANWCGYCGSQTSPKPEEVERELRASIDHLYSRNIQLESENQRLTAENAGLTQQRDDWKRIANERADENAGLRDEKAILNYSIELMVAAGLITQAKVEESRSIALKFYGRDPMSKAARGGKS